jgi:hypothetical protein
MVKWCRYTGVAKVFVNGAVELIAGEVHAAISLLSKIVDAIETIFDW